MKCANIKNFVPNTSRRKIRAFSVQNSGAELIADFAAWTGPTGTTG
jgi:hypothetical protein